MPFDYSNPIPGAGAVAVSPYDTPEPGIMDTVEAAFRQDNLIGSALSRISMSGPPAEQNSIDRNYNVFQDADFSSYVDEDPDRWSTIYNKTAAVTLRSRIEQERKDKRVLDASGWGSWLLAEGAANILDPTNLLPAGEFVKAGRVGYGALRSAARIGLAAGVSTAAQEAGLQATQEARTATETGLSIGGSMVLGGLIGGAAGKFFSKVEWDRVSSRLESDLVDDVADPEAVAGEIVRRMQSTGAAVTDTVDLQDLGIGGSRAAELVARATAAIRLNPGVETMLSPSRTVRQVYAQLVDNPIMTRMNMEGRTLGPDVENLVKFYQRGALASWMDVSKKTFRDARKNGYKGTLAEFYDAVAKAGRRGDVAMDGNEYVTRAAVEARTKVFDPLLERAKAAGLLPDDVKTTTAASYVTRLWNRYRLVGEEKRFREIARRYFQGELDKAVIRQEEVQLGNKVVDVLSIDERMAKAADRVTRLEERLAGRMKTRGGLLGRVRGEEARRFDFLRDRAPRELVDAIRNAAENDTLVSAVKEARRAQNVKVAKTPVLSILRKRGGVRIGSPLAGNLRAMGVTPKTAPGLFRKGSGLGAADNIVAAEFDVLQTLPTDANGYVDENALMDAIRSEVAGDALRTTQELELLDTADVLAENVDEWLSALGLRSDVTIKELRESLEKVLSSEVGLSDVDTRIARLNREIEEFDTATDSIRNEFTVSKAEADNVAKELRTLEDEINASADLAKSSPVIARMVDYAKIRREYGKARYDEIRVTNRLEALRRVDAEGRLNYELEAELMALEKELPEVTARVEKARAKSDKLKPYLPKKKDPIPDFISEDDRADYIEEIVSSVFNNLTGKGQGEVPEWIIPVTRGPLKERTFNIPDEMVEDFLENDMEKVMRRYTRVMGAEVELAEKFGRADMKTQFEDITREYAELRAAAKTPDEISKIDAAERRDVKNLAAFRDMIRGTYRGRDQSSSWSHVTRAALTWNYIRMLGGVGLTSLTDAANIIGKFGLRASATEPARIFAAKIKGNKALQIATAEARDFGVVTDKLLQSRLASWADLADPYASGSRFERMLDNASNAFSKMTFLGHLNDFTRTIVSVMTQNRILNNALRMVDETTGIADFAKLDPAERAVMASLGIDESMASRVAGQYRKYGMQEDGILGANASDWDDALARRTWAAALNKMADQTIIMKGVADNPLWMKTNTGAMLAQFKGFMLAAHQRLLIAGLQQRQHRLAEILLFGTGVGMMISYLKYVERGDFEAAQNLLDNPGLWIANGVDRSSVLAVPFEVSNTLEKWNIPGMTVGAQYLAGDENKSGGSSRYASRGKFGAIGGPTVGTIEDLATIASQLLNGDVKKSGINAAIRQLPGTTLPGFRTGINVGLKPALGLDN